MMKKLRTFVAIDLEPQLRTALADAQADLRKNQAARLVRWVRPASIHLTLKFLGDVPATQVTAISKALENGCATFLPFDICLSGLGCFPNPRRPRVIWVGVGGDVVSLKDLQRSLDSELGHLGFRAEKRGFIPHLTLGRFRDRALPHERQDIIERMRHIQVSPFASMTVTELSLIRSDLRPSGAVYSRLSSAQLGAAVR
jgi:2'-5' RNA ligase